MQMNLDHLQPGVFTFVFPHIRGNQCSFLSPVYEHLATPVWEQAAISGESVAPRQRVPHKKPQSVSSGFAPNWILLVVFEAFFLGASPDWNDADLRDPRFLFFVFKSHRLPECGAWRSRSAPEVWSEAALTIRVTTCLEINRGDIYKAVGSSSVPRLCMTQSVCARARPLLPVCTCSCVQ